MMFLFLSLQASKKQKLYHAERISEYDVIFEAVKICRKQGVGVSGKIGCEEATAAPSVTRGDGRSCRCSYGLLFQNPCLIFSCRIIRHIFLVKDEGFFASSHKTCLRKGVPHFNSILTSTILKQVSGSFFYISFALLDIFCFLLANIY